MARIDDIIKAGDPAVTRAQIEDFMRQVRAQIIILDAEGDTAERTPKMNALIAQYDRLEARLNALGEPAAK